MSTMNANWLIRSRLKTRHLLLLVALDEHRNVHRAAEHLAMSQPAVSKLLVDLEQGMDVQLFERVAKGVEPTWYGETLIRHARMVLASLDQANDDIQSRKAGLSGRVNIGSIVGPTANLLPSVIQEMSQRYPKVQVGVTMDLSRVLLKQLATGQLDFLVARLFEEDDKSLFSFERLGSEPVSLVVGAGHPLVRARKLTLERLLSQSWILPPAGGVLRHRFDLAFRANGLTPPKTGVETLSLSLMVELLLSTDMVAIMSTAVAERYVQHKMLAYLPVVFDCDGGDFGLVTRDGVLLSPAAQTALALLQQAAVGGR